MPNWLVWCFSISACMRNVRTSTYTHGYINTSSLLRLGTTLRVLIYLQLRRNARTKDVSKGRWEGRKGGGCGGGPCRFKDSRVVNDLLKDSPSFKVVKKLCNRGLVSLQFMKNFKERFAAIKAVINSKPERAVDDEEYWLGKLIRQHTGENLTRFN